MWESPQYPVISRLNDNLESPEVRQPMALIQNWSKPQLDTVHKRAQTYCPSDQLKKRDKSVLICVRVCTVFKGDSDEYRPTLAFHGCNCLGSKTRIFCNSLCLAWDMEGINLGGPFEAQPGVNLNCLMGADSSHEQNLDCYKRT